MNPSDAPESLIDLCESTRRPFTPLKNGFLKAREEPGLPHFALWMHFDRRNPSLLATNSLYTSPPVLPRHAVTPTSTPPKPPLTHREPSIINQKTAPMANLHST